MKKILFNTSKKTLIGLFLLKSYKFPPGEIDIEKMNLSPTAINYFLKKFPQLQLKEKEVRRRGRPRINNRK